MVDITKLIQSIQTLLVPWRTFIGTSMVRLWLVQIKAWGQHRANNCIQRVIQEPFFSLPRNSKESCKYGEYKNINVEMKNVQNICHYFTKYYEWSPVSLIPHSEILSVKCTLHNVYMSPIILSFQNFLIENDKFICEGEWWIAACRPSFLLEDPTTAQFYTPVSPTVILIRQCRLVVNISSWLKIIFLLIT